MQRCSRADSAWTVCSVGQVSRTRESAFEARVAAQQVAESQRWVSKR